MNICDIYVNMAKDLFYSQNVQTLILDDQFDNICDTDYSFRRNLYPNKNPYEDLKNWLINECTYPNIYILETPYHICNVYLKLPDENDKDRFLSIGPFLFDRLSSDEIHKLMDSIDPSPQMVQKVLDFYNNLPLGFSLDKFQAFLTAFFTPILGQDMRIIYKQTSDSLNSFSLTDDSNLDSSDCELSLSLIEERYDIEDKMITAVKKQNVDEAILLNKKLSLFNYGKRTSSPLQSSKNFLIVLNTLLRTAVKDCDIHPFYIDKISYRFAIEIDQCTNRLQTQKLSAKMIQEYCNLISEHSMKNYSGNIQNCITYIDFHYNENLSLQEMAEHLNLNESYLSTLFKKEIGIPFTTYVTQTRIKQALILLNSTKKSIQDIAYQCGFYDINYFSRIFKRYQGMSPSEYRKMTIKQ